MNIKLPGIAGVAIAWMTSGPLLAAASTQTPIPFIVGIGRSIHDSTGTSTALGWLGVQAVRLDVPWAQVETSPGVYAMPAWADRAVDDARAQGIETLAILAYGHPQYGGDKPRTAAQVAAFARYAGFVVKHFKGRVSRFDLWNEWETQTGRTTPGSAADYVRLAKKAYPAVKAANADALLLLGGMLGVALDSGWFESFLTQDGLRYVDGLSVHPYNYQKSGTDLPERAIDTLDRMHALALSHAGGRAVNIYVTEMGYPTHTGKGGVSEAVAATFLARFYLLASTRDFITGVWWYCLRDQGPDRTDKEQNFGVMDSAMTPKSMARTLRELSALFSQTGRLRDTSQAAQRSVAGAREDGGAVLLSWDSRSIDISLLNELAAMAQRPEPPESVQADRG